MGSFNSVSRHTSISPSIAYTQTQGDSIDPRFEIELVSPDGEALQSVPSPSPIVWIGPALLCSLAYAFYNIFIKLGSASIHPILGGVILQTVAALLGSFLLICIVIQNGANVHHWDTTGIRWPVCAGLAVGVAEMLSFFVSSSGVQAVQSIPTIIGGSVFFGCVLGAVLLQESLTFRGWSGVVLICVGITLVGLDH